MTTETAPTATTQSKPPTKRDWLYQVAGACLEQSLRAAKPGESGTEIVERADIMRKWLIASWEITEPEEKA